MIGILSLLHNNNFGSVLQCYALERTLEGMGFACEHIDYRMDIQEKTRNLLRCGNSPRLLAEGWRKRRMVRTDAASSAKQKALEQFIARELHLSPVCRNHKALEAIRSRYDLLLCGSDQIWSPTWLNPSYFLDFAGDTPKLAYACSLGVSSLPGRHKQKLMRQALRGFQGISVREEEGASLLEALTGQRPDVCPDPVVLLEKSQWLAMAGKPAGKETKTSSMVCYFLGDAGHYQERVQTLSETMALKPLLLPFGAEAVHRTDWEKADAASPEDFLHCLSDAGLVCTDSFHGAMLACVLERPFFVCLRDAQADPKNRNSRVLSLLRRMQASPWEVVEMTEERRLALAAWRAEGLQWLKSHVTYALASGK